jgi:glycerophosphoryl diester phosphodiesterase
MNAENLGLDTLDQNIPSPEDHALALRHAPRLRFDRLEPFLPSVVGYTVFRGPGASPSFPRDIVPEPGVATVIEYAIWWDWDMQHLYELEHVWVWLDADENLVGGEASWHGGMHRMLDENGQMPSLDGRLMVYSEPGKHAFAPSAAWLLERAPKTRRSVGVNAGRMGVHVTPLFEGIITSRTPQANRAVHSYLDCLAFEPSFEFEQIFPLKQAVHVPWPQLFAWIPKRVAWWADHLEATLPFSDQHLYTIAHRGASAYAAENSLDAFVKAAEMKSDLVEIDIRVTKDGVPVVTHDETLLRTFGVNATIAQVTLDELHALTPEGMAPVPTFDAVAKICADLEMGLYLDIKEVDAAALEKMFATLRHHGLMKYSIAGSFRPDFVAEIKHAEPKLLTSILFNSVNIDPVALACSVNADYVHPCWERRAEQPHKLLTPDWLARVRAAKLGIVIWHEERPEEIAALRALGVDMICTDTPDRVSIYKTECR